MCSADLLDVLSNKAACDFLIIWNEEEGFGLWWDFGLHLLEAQVIVHHFSDLFNLKSSKTNIINRHNMYQDSNWKSSKHAVWQQKTVWVLVNGNIWGRNKYLFQRVLRIIREDKNNLAIRIFSQDSLFLPALDHILQ